VFQQIVDAFVTATTTAVGEWVGADIAVRAATRSSPPGTPGAMLARIDLDGEQLLRLNMIFPPSTAMALARLALRDAAINPDLDLVRDCMCEIANIVAGQAKALLAGTPLHFSFSPPKLDAGPNPDSFQGVAISFVCELREFAAEISVRPDSTR
jgi:CheY-specific phosphatase CheX